MTSNIAWLSLWLVGVGCIACAGDDQGSITDAGAAPRDAEPADAETPDAETNARDSGDDSAVPDAAIDEQRQGDPVRGRSLLLNNGTEEAPYLSCGVPRSILDGLTDAGLDPFADSIKLEERERGNADLPYDMS